MHAQYSHPVIGSTFQPFRQAILQRTGTHDDMSTSNGDLVPRTDSEICRKQILTINVAYWFSGLRCLSHYYILIYVTTTKPWRTSSWQMESIFIMLSWSHHFEILIDTVMTWLAVRNICVIDDQGYVPFVVVAIPSPFLPSLFITRFYIRGNMTGATEWGRNWLPLRGTWVQYLLSGVRVAQSIFFCIFSFVHCVVLRFTASDYPFDVSLNFSYNNTLSVMGNWYVYKYSLMGNWYVYKYSLMGNWYVYKYSLDFIIRSSRWALSQDPKRAKDSKLIALLGFLVSKGFT